MGVKDALRRRLPGPADDRLERLEALVEDHAARLRRQGARMSRLDQRFAQLSEDVGTLLLVGERIRGISEIVGRQLASLEVRVADLVERFEASLTGAAGVPAGATAGDGTANDAGALLAEIRTEHARIRERFGVVTAFEERLRRLEEALVVDTQRTLEEYEAAARALARDLREGSAATGSSDEG